MIKSLSDIKRLPIGTKLELVNSLLGPCNKSRTIMKINFNSIQFTGDGIPDGGCSWWFFPKAKYITFNEDGFYETSEDGQIEVHYRYTK